MNYTLLTYNTSSNSLTQTFSEKNTPMTVIKLNPKTREIYSNNYYLLRPDWHIVWTDNYIPEKNIVNFIIESQYLGNK